MLDTQHDETAAKAHTLICNLKAYAVYRNVTALIRDIEPAVCSSRWFITRTAKALCLAEDIDDLVPM